MILDVDLYILGSLILQSLCTSTSITILNPMQPSNKCALLYTVYGSCKTNEDLITGDKARKAKDTLEEEKKRNLASDSVVMDFTNH